MPFKREKEIQLITEANLSLIFGLSFVRSEFSLNSYRIDTLAFDENTSSFVIIEYKRDKSFSMIDQGHAYLSLMLNNKAEFVLDFNENSDKTLRKNDVDWDKSKIIFISQSFTPYQREAINFKDLPMELWEIARYDNHTISYYHITTQDSKGNIKSFIQKSEDIEKDIGVEKDVDEAKIYTEDEHLEKADVAIRELYKRLKNAIFKLGDFELRVNKYYVSFVARSNIVDMNIQRKQLKIWINLSSGELDDPRGISRDVSSIGHWGNGDYEVIIRDDQQLDYLLGLIKQSLMKHKSKNSGGLFD